MTYHLGLDLGSNSVGWAALSCDVDQPSKILASGVRIFAAGMNGLEAGRDESHAAQRRAARLSRRQTDRRRRRIAKIYGLLARFGLLPRAPDAEGRTAALTALDRELAAKHT